MRPRMLASQFCFSLRNALPPRSRRQPERRRFGWPGYWRRRRRLRCPTPSCRSGSCIPAWPPNTGLLALLFEVATVNGANGAGERQVAVVAVAPAPAAVEPEIDAGPGRSHDRRSYVGRRGPYTHIRGKRALGKPNAHRSGANQRDTLHTHPLQIPLSPVTRFVRRVDQESISELPLQRQSRRVLR